MLREAVEGANLYGRRAGQYSLHCFRRGGAQHRFIHIKIKWSFTAVKWWGGWAAGERIDTIMKYLMEDAIGN